MADKRTPAERRAALHGSIATCLGMLTLAELRALDDRLVEILAQRDPIELGLAELVHNAPIEKDAC